MIYLDNSASSYPKPKQVKDATLEALEKYSANPGRSGHDFSIDTAMKIMEVRQNVCDFFSCSKPERVIFTGGCTEALNLAILGTYQQGGHIICTVNDHNSVLRSTWHLKEKYGIEISYAVPSKPDRLTISDIEKHVKPNTYLICVNHISNVDGMITDLEEIGEFCAQRCILFLVDAAQSAGHLCINMQRQNIDLLAVAGHKGLYGIQGAGALCFSAKTKLRPIKFGGTGTSSVDLNQPTGAPEGYESGTLPTPAIIALGAGIDFVKGNQQLIDDKIEDLTTYLIYELKRNPKVIVYTHPDNHHGVVSFNIEDKMSTEVTDILNQKYKICARSGLHCAPLKHKFMGTLEQGTVRLSLSAFTTFTEISKTIKAVHKIANGSKMIE